MDPFGRLLVSPKPYRVPLFQRAYAWEQPHVHDLWSDVMAVMDGGQDFFLGSMVFAPDEGRPGYLVLDGQQRFASLLLLIAALRECVKASKLADKKKRIVALNQLVFKTDAKTMKELPTLELGQEDRDFFSDLVVSGVRGSPVIGSHKRMLAAFDLFVENLQPKVKVGKDQFVEDLVGTIRDKFWILQLEVQSDADAYLIFETLNDRGLELTVADLVKNRILSIAGQAGLDVHEMASKWKGMVDEVGDDSVTSFLRHFWLSSEGMARKEDLYKQIRGKITEKSVDSFVAQLAVEATAYSDLADPTPASFGGDQEVVDLLRDLNELGGSQVAILLLAAHARYKNDLPKLKTVIRDLTNFTFRYTTIGKENPNELEKTYSDLAIKLRKKEAGTEEILERVRALQPSEDKFLAAFADFQSRSNKLARHILIKICDFELSARGDKEVATRKTKINLEHILPKKPAAKWRKLYADLDLDPEDYMYRLGNMTLLLTEYNRDASNKFFPDKKPMHAKSNLPINTNLPIATVSKWDPNAIAARQEYYCKIATQVWKLR